MDQNLMAPNLSAIARLPWPPSSCAWLRMAAPTLTKVRSSANILRHREFGMDDEERDRKLGGEIAFAFFLLGAPAALGIGFATGTDDFTWRHKQLLTHTRSCRNQ